MGTVFTSRLLSCPTGENKLSLRIDQQNVLPFFQLHMQYENYLERGRDGGCEGSPSNQEGFRDHQELCQQVPSPFFSMSLKVVASNRFHLSLMYQFPFQPFEVSDQSDEEA